MSFSFFLILLLFYNIIVNFFGEPLFRFCPQNRIIVRLLLTCPIVRIWALVFDSLHDREREKEKEIKILKSTRALCIPRMPSRGKSQIEKGEPWLVWFLVRVCVELKARASADRILNALLIESLRLERQNRSFSVIWKHTEKGREQTWITFTVIHQLTDCVAFVHTLVPRLLHVFLFLSFWP